MSVTFLNEATGRHSLLSINHRRLHHRLYQCNFHAKLTCMTSYSQTSSEPRREFRDLLYRQKQLTDQLLGGLDDPNVSSVGLVELIEAIERLDGRKAELAGVFRAEASSLRRREEDRSIRQVILRALEFVSSPQPAWFLQEFVWARDRIDLKTRGFGVTPARRISSMEPPAWTQTRLYHSCPGLRRSCSC